MVLAAEHPHLYAACLLVDGQWKPETLKPLADQKFFYFAAGGDSRALGGMQDLIPVLKKAGADIVTAEWNAKWPASRLESAAKKVISKGSTTNCITWKKGTVLPANASSGSNEHMKNKMQMLVNFIAEPGILLLDEPLTSFDVVVADEMKKLLRNMKEDHIIIFSTHIMELALDLCDEIVILNDGVLQEIDKADLDNSAFKDKIIAVLRGGDNV